MRSRRELKTMPTIAPVEPAPEREFVDIPNAASWAYVSNAHIRRLLTEGKLTCYKFGARTLIKFDELRALVKSVQP